MLRHTAGCLCSVVPNYLNLLVQGHYFKCHLCHYIRKQARPSACSHTDYQKDCEVCEYLYSLCGLLYSTHAICSCCNKYILRLKFTDARIPCSKNNLRIEVKLDFRR
jgi:hypothetical protein